MLAVMELQPAVTNLMIMFGNLLPTAPFMFWEQIVDDGLTLASVLKDVWPEVWKSAWHSSCSWHAALTPSMAQSTRQLLSAWLRCTPGNSLGRLYAQCICSFTLTQRQSQVWSLDQESDQE